MKSSHFTICWIALGLIFSSIVCASDATVPCKPCAAGVQNVSLFMISSELNTADSYFLARKINFSPPADAPPMPDIVFDSEEQIKAALINTANQCKRIKYLYIISHGFPGGIVTSDGNANLQSWGRIVSTIGITNKVNDHSTKRSELSVETISNYDEGLECAMAPGAEIEFGGCEVAKGCDGENFLKSVSEKLLKKGGKVRGFTANSIGGLFGINGQYQSLTVGDGLTNPKWRSTPQSPSQCKKEIVDMHATLRMMKRMFSRCEPSERYRKEFNIVEKVLADTIEMEYPSAESQVTVAPSDFYVLRSHYASVSQYQYIQSQYLREVSPCRPVNAAAPRTTSDAQLVK